MARIAIRIRMTDFAVEKLNEPGLDEPYLLNFFARLDGSIADPAVPLEQRTVPLHFPLALGHKDLGPESNGMTLHESIPVPRLIGDWRTTLDTTNLDFSIPTMNNCSAGFAVVFLEEDSSLDSTIQTALPLLKQAVQERADLILRIALGFDPPFALNDEIQEYIDHLRAGRLDPNGIDIGSGLLTKVLAAIIPLEGAKAVAKGLAPGELANWIATIVQAEDHDEYCGTAGLTIPFYDFVGLAHAPLPFRVESFIGVELAPGQVQRVTTNGIYSINGVTQRTDADEPPVLAAIRGPGQQAIIVARSCDGNHFQRQISSDLGETFSFAPAGNFGAGEFLAGPAADSAANGQVQFVVGLGMDSEVWWARSDDGGANWNAWNQIPVQKKFRSSPAVALSSDGARAYVVARDAQGQVWYSRSLNGGLAWSQWERIGNTVLHSSPSIVCLRNLRARPNNSHVLVVAGLGADKRVWTCRFPETEDDLGDVLWNPIPGSDEPTKVFTSAPAMMTDRRDQVLLLCRGSDLRYHAIQSLDGGRKFGVGTVWLPMGRPELGPVTYSAAEPPVRSGDLQRMYSAPAVVAGEDFQTRIVVGLSPTLGIWRNKARPPAVSTWRPVTAQEPEPELRLFYY